MTTEQQPENLNLQALEKRLIEKAFERYPDKNKTHIASILGISERVLYFKLHQHNLFSIYSKHK